MSKSTAVHDNSSMANPSKIYGKFKKMSGKSVMTDLPFIFLNSLKGGRRILL